MFKALNNKRNSHVAQLQKINSKMNRNPHKAHQQFTLISVSPSVHPLGDPAPQTSPGEQDLAWGQQISISRGTGGNLLPAALFRLRKHFGRCPGAQASSVALAGQGQSRRGHPPALLAPAGTRGQRGRAGTQGQGLATAHPASRPCRAARWFCKYLLGLSLLAQG